MSWKMADRQPQFDAPARTVTGQPVAGRGSVDPAEWRYWFDRRPTPIAKRDDDPDAERLFDLPAPRAGLTDREHSSAYHGSAHDQIDGTISLNRRSSGAPPVDVAVEPSPTIASAAQAKGVWQVEDRRNPEWVTVDGELAEGTEWAEEQPATTVCADPRIFPPGHFHRNDEALTGWSDEDLEVRPATTVAGDPRIFPPGHKINADDEARLGAAEAGERYGKRSEGIRVELEDVLILQSFPQEYPLQGSRTERFRQVGNAWPPRAAAHVLAAAAGLDAPDFPPAWPVRDRREAGPVPDTLRDSFGVPAEDYPGRTESRQKPVEGLAPTVDTKARNWTWSDGPDPS